MPASLKDIADEVDVSISLVSKVLSGKLGTTGASAAKTARIRQAAARLGYQRNRTAAALVSGRHHAVAVFIHRLGVSGSGIVEQLIRGISQTTNARGLRLWLDFFEHSEEFQDKCPAADGSQVDGVIVGGIPHRALVGELLERVRAGVPVVTVHDNVLHPMLCNVGCDQWEVGYLAASHLIDKGCQQIVDMGGALPGRGEGCVAAVCSAGSNLEAPIRIPLAGFSYGEGRAAIREFIDSNVPFDAVFAHSDQIALAVVHELQDRGIRIPEDVRVIGVDNSPFCEFAVLPLSSVEQNYELRGARAAQALMDSIDGHSPKALTIAPKIIERKSTA